MSESPAVVADPTDLLGGWRFSRVIEDRREACRHHIDGRLELSVVGRGRIRWRESGQWHQETGDVEVQRNLWLEREGGRWFVRFEDGRDFHEWSPGRVVSHACSPDTYRGVVEGSPERWTVRWDVAGPHKDYTMTTVLTREG
jgi:hypothetical protein